MTQEDYLFYLRKKNYTITSQRKILINYFYNNREKAVSAKKIISNLKKTNKKISFDTIYKNLNLFVNIQILECEKIDGEKHFNLGNPIFKGRENEQLILFYPLNIYIKGKKFSKHKII